MTLLPLWAVRPVQSLSACTRVHFTLPQCLYKGAFYLTSVPYKVALYLTSVPVQGCTLPYLSACTRVHFTLPQCLYKGDLYLTFALNRDRKLILTLCNRVLAVALISTLMCSFKTPCVRGLFAYTWASKYAKECKRA